MQGPVGVRQAAENQAHGERLSRESWLGTVTWQVAGAGGTGGSPDRPEDAAGCGVPGHPITEHRWARVP